MKFPRFHFRLSLVLLFTQLVGCASGATPQLAETDFMALNGGHAYTIHIDGAGKASMQPIDFLKDEVVTQWDAAGLDQVVITNQAGFRGGEVFEFKYYKNKTYLKSFRVANVNALAWLMLLPDKNCLIVYIMDGGGIKRLVKIDLASGDQKEIQLNGQFLGIMCRPVWDKAKGSLIIVLTDKKSVPSPYVDSLARLNPDDLTITDKVALDNTEIDGLLFSDAAGEKVIAYGVIGGGDPHMLSSTGTSGFIEFNLATGKPTLVMKDTSTGAFVYGNLGIAVLNNRYVMMTKEELVSFSASGPYHSYRMDLQEKSVLKLSDIPAFAYPISHDGLLLASPASATPAK